MSDESRQTRVRSLFNFKADKRSDSNIKFVTTIYWGPDEHLLPVKIYTRFIGKYADISVYHLSGWSSYPAKKKFSNWVYLARLSFIAGEALQVWLGARRSV